MKNFTYILTILLVLNINLLAKNNVATITALKGNADIKRDSSLLLASIGDKLDQKDNIVTKDNSKVQIIFEDETVVSIGKNSEFSIQEYLFEDNAAPVAKFSMLKGAMRTITGQIGNVAPNRFSVSTKTATIGIRGTNFSIFVEDDGSSSAFCTYGAISVSIAGVVHIVPQGFYINVSPSGKVEIKELTPQVLKAAKKKHFDSDKKEKTAKANVGDGKGDGNEEVASSSSDSQLDVTIDDNSGMIITELSNEAGDGIQTSGNLTPNSVIAGYSQQNVQYTGTYTSSAAGGGELGTSGVAKLSIYFGTNTDNSTLTLIGSAGAEYQYNGFEGLDTNTFSGGTYQQGVGSASGQFFGPTGNNVQGTYSHGSGPTITSQGTYNVENTDGMSSIPQG